MYLGFKKVGFALGLGLVFSSCGGDTTVIQAEPSSSSKATESVSVADFATMKCSATNEGDQVQVQEVDLVYTCMSMDVGGQSVYSWYPVAESEDALGNCTASENMGKGYYVPAEKAVFTCMGNGWIKTDLSSIENPVDPGASSSSGSVLPGDPSSSSTNPGVDPKPAQKVVEFEDGILWKPSYELRARTFFNTVDEYTFFSPNSVTKDSSGWWEKYLDVVDNGASTAKGEFTDEYLDLNITLNYVNWSLATDGEYSYNAPNPYPYGGFQFALSPADGGYVDLSSWGGVCVTYTSTEPFAFAVRSALTDLTDGMHWEASVSPSTAVKTIEISFSKLTRSPYAEAIVDRANAVKKATGFQIAYRNDEADITCPSAYDPEDCDYMQYSASNHIKIYKIGKTGTCSGSSGGNIL